MRNKQFITIALVGFLLGVVVIVLLQVLAGRNINRLIQGNDKLLHELQVQNQLRRIEAEIVSLESDVRGTVISGNPVYMQNLEAAIGRITGQLSELERELRRPEAEAGVRRLDYLVTEKIRFNRHILRTFTDNGKSAAEAVVHTGRGRALRDSIVWVLNDLDAARQQETEVITRSFEASSRQARTWGFVLAIIACVVVIAAFWYIVSQSQHQQKVIENLNESERRIKEAANLKEQFMANMSHEIRTPMNAIIGFTNLLRRTQLEPSQREYVQNIHSAGDNLLALINDILDLSKIEAGMMQLEESRFSIRSMTASVAAMFMDKVREKGLQLHTEVDDEVPDILSGDAIRLTQVLVNLLGNAVKFTETGHIWLKVALLEQHHQKVSLALTVTDTGIGIPAEKLNAIFDRFQQAEAATTRRFGGTGLGLSIVKQLVELQGGSIMASSEPGKGSCFTVHINYRIPDISEVASAALMADTVPVVPEDVHLLIAEDNAMNQQLMRYLMRNWGYRSTIVNNGAEAVEVLRNQQFLLVLMDIQMPEMDGYIATSVIRNELKLDIPIIAMTAHAMIGEKEKCLQLGMNDYISKPIKENELYNIIASFAQKAAREQDLDPAGTASNGFAYLDLGYLRQLSGGDEAFEREMLAQFTVQVPEELGALSDAYASGDLLRVKAMAHTLKSTLGYMGLSDRVRPQLDTIEQAARDGEFATIEPLINSVDDIARKALAEVAEALQHA